MLEFFASLPIIVMALLAGIFCSLCTSLGASFVFFFKNANKNILTALLSLASGVMIASSFFSLIIPAINYCDSNWEKFVYVVGGLFLGGLILYIFNKAFDKKFDIKSFKNANKRNILLTASITLHNIPEGMAIGVAFGALFGGFDAHILSTAILLSIGIGIQNIPEGASVSIPLKRDNVGTFKAFMWGVFSGIVEPIFVILACLFSMIAFSFLPLLLAISAGIMLAVSASELIPEAMKSNKNISILFFSLGFCIMSTLDILLS